MYRVNLDYGVNPSIMKNNNRIENIYNQIDGVVVGGSGDNGVYHIVNARKDKIKILGDNDNLDELRAAGYMMTSGDMFRYNVVVSPAPLGRLYTVKPTDTIDSIANDFGVSAESLIKVNNLRSSTLFIGQKLHIK